MYGKVWSVGKINIKPSNVNCILNTIQSRGLGFLNLKIMWDANALVH